MALGVGSLGRESRRSWVTASFAHVIGGVVGGSSAGVTTWLLVTPFRTVLPGPALILLTAGVVVIAVRRDWLYKVTGHGKQVPQEWLREFGKVKAFLLYGGVLGAGFVTKVPHGSFYVVMLLPALLGGIGAASLAGLLFGASRSLTVIIASLHPGRSSRLLHRSRTATIIYPKVSIIVSLLTMTFWLAF